ncbi:hypothetical protein SAMN07250955_101313 [Arboricoccus pini]|uniref:Uncharacterized protein n=2 Tax=Arboricoccus pini TaxID=1963835 RepID=A0A212Q0T5_9PROT|nr:hypothetical protein SAMN07250955_101313 [Arboricoccus pini]
MGGKNKDSAGDGNGPLIEGSYFVAEQGYAPEDANERTEAVPTGTHLAPREFRPYAPPEPVSRNTRHHRRSGRILSNGKLFDIEA